MLGGLSLEICKLKKIGAIYMGISYAVTDKTRINTRVTSNIINLTIKNTQTGTIEIGPLANIGTGTPQGYMTEKIEAFKIDQIMIVPTAKAYTVSLQAKINGSIWEKLAVDIVRVTGDKEVLIITSIKNLIHRYPIKIILTTAIASDEIYTVYIPVKVVGGTEL